MTQAAERSHLPDLERALPFHRKEWVFQRWGWAVMALFIVAAGSGLLGPGGFFRQSAGHDPLRVSFDRFGRREADLDFSAALRVPAGGNTLRLAFSADCLHDAEMQWMKPQPDTSVAGTRGGLIYVFRRDPNAGEIEIEWSLKPQHAGRRGCQIGFEGASAAFRQWIWP